MIQYAQCTKWNLYHPPLTASNRTPFPKLAGRKAAPFPKRLGHVLGMSEATTGSDCVEGEVCLRKKLLHGSEADSIDLLARAATDEGLHAPFQNRSGKGRLSGDAGDVDALRSILPDEA